MVVGKMSEKIVGGDQLQDRVAEELQRLVVTTVQQQQITANMYAVSHTILSPMCGLVVWWLGRGFDYRPLHFQVTTLGKLITHMSLCVIWYCLFHQTNILKQSL